MVSPPSSGAPVRVALFAFAALAFAVSAVVATVAFRAQRLVVPADLQFDFEAAANSAERVLTYHAERLFVPPLILAAGKPARLALGELPHGAELSLVGWRGAGHRFAKIDVMAGNRQVGIYDGETGSHAGIVAHGARLILKKDDSGTELTLLLRKCVHWTGYVIVQTQPRAAQFARWALPASSVILLLAFAWCRPRPVVLVPAFATVLGILYWHTLATAKIGPIGDYFFSDSLDFLVPLTRGQFTSDMAKHLLFYPFARTLYLVFSCAGFAESTALTAVFATFGVGNALLAWGWMRRVLPGPRSAALVAVVHAFCFAPWAFASHYETYAASSAAAHGVLWLLARGTIRNAAVDTLLQGGAGAVAALLHPPLLVLPSLGALRFRDQPFGRRLFRAGQVVVVAFVLYAAGATVLRRTYGEPVDKATMKADTSSAWSTFVSYSRPEARTLRHVATVVNGQCLFAMAGLGHPVEWERPTAPLTGYARTLSGWIAGPLVAAFWIVGLYGAWNDRRFRSVLFAGGALVAVPTLLFYWMFNPSEMLLYSSPLVGAMLVALAGGWITWLGERRSAFAFTVFAVALAVHNGLCLATFP